MPNSFYQYFRVNLWFVLLVVAVLFIMLRAGFWQLDRAQQKIARQQALAAASELPITELVAPLPPVTTFQFRTVALSGQYLGEQQFLLDNQVRGDQLQDKQIGYDVITPLKIATGEIVLVNRGWVPAALSRQQLPDVKVGLSDRQIRGTLNIPGKGFRLGEMDSDLSWPRVIQYLDYQQISEYLQADVYPAIIMLNTEQDDGYVRQWQPVTEGPEKHYSYAVQWFLMSVALIILFIIAIWKRTEHDRDTAK